MRAARTGHRLALLTAPALFALTSCGIPATGVVEAGGPASGIQPITPIYFLRGDALIAVPRVTTSPGDVGVALKLLLLGPTRYEATTYGTVLFQLSTGSDSTPVPTVPVESPGESSASEAESGAVSGAASGAASEAVPAPESTGAEEVETPAVKVDGDTVTAEISYPVVKLPELAIRQLVCTAAAAHRIGAPSTDPVTVVLTDRSGRRTRGTDEGCPGLGVG